MCYLRIFTSNVIIFDVYILPFYCDKLIKTHAYANLIN